MLIIFIKLIVATLIVTVIAAIATVLSSHRVKVIKDGKVEASSFKTAAEAMNFVDEVKKLEEKNLKGSKYHVMENSHMVSYNPEGKLGSSLQIFF